MLHTSGIILLVAGYVTTAPAADCATCHPKQAEAHGRTHHARSLRPVLETEFARSLPEAPIGEARGGFLLTYRKEGGGLIVNAERGGEQAQARLFWAFGAGDQGVTPLALLNGRWLEHRISYYPKAQRFDLTLGHQPGPSASAAAAIGVPQPDATLRACLGCHATVDTDLAIVQPGIDCDRCHAVTRTHPPAKPAQADRVEVCASCHRLTPPNGNQKDPLNIRFQPLRLAMSKCYSAGELTCVTCHPPHENARRADAAFYQTRCKGCHSKPHRPDACLDCHMPKSSPAPYLTFTDHYIRVSRSR